MFVFQCFVPFFFTSMYLIHYVIKNVFVSFRKKKAPQIATANGRQYFQTNYVYVYMEIKFTYIDINNMYVKICNLCVRPCVVNDDRQLVAALNETDGFFSCVTPSDDEHNKYKHTYIHMYILKVSFRFRCFIFFVIFSKFLFLWFLAIIQFGSF